MLRCFSHVQLFANLWAVVHQAPLFMGFSRQEFWSRWSQPPPGDVPDLWTEPAYLVSSVLKAEFLLLSHWQYPTGEL